MRAATKAATGRRKIHVDLPEEIHRKSRVKAALEDVSMQTFVAWGGGEGGQGRAGA